MPKSTPYCLSNNKLAIVEDQKADPRIYNPKKIAEFCNEQYAAYFLKAVNYHDELVDYLEKISKQVFYNDVAEINLHGSEVNDLFKLLKRVRGE